MKKDTINFAELMGGLIEMQDVCGDKTSPQHFTPPQNAFELHAVNGIIDEALPMSDYLNRKEIGSTTFGKLAQSELAFLYEMQRPNTESTKAQITGTAVHSYLEAWAAGIGLDAYLNELIITPTFNRGTTDGVLAEIDFYSNLLGVSSDITIPDKIAGRKELANELLASCEKGYSLVSKKDAATVTGVANELQRRHNETGLFDWLQHAKPEVSFFMGRFKCRPDLLCDGLIVSIKTCARIERAEQDAKYSYGLKEAFYRYIIEQVTGKPHQTAMLFFETVEPYQSRLLFVSDATAEYYDQQVLQLIEQAERCLTSGKFRGYDAGLEYGAEII